MFWTDLSSEAAILFLIFARVFAMLSIAPLFSSRSLPGLVRVGLSLLTAILVLPSINPAELSSLDSPIVNAGVLGFSAATASIVDIGLKYVFLLIGESLIGIMQGFFLLLITAAIQTAGQFFSTQMGFGASAVFDPLAQEEIPLMGQFFNLVALLVFLLIEGFQKVFFTGVIVSFQAVRAADLIRAKGVFADVFAGGFFVLFQQAVSMALPILGTLFLVSITMGLLAKAAPQMNLLILGFPFAILVGFGILLLIIPSLMNRFAILFENAFPNLESMLLELRGGQL